MHRQAYPETYSWFGRYLPLGTIWGLHAMHVAGRIRHYCIEHTYAELGLAVLAAILRWVHTRLTKPRSRSACPRAT
jgi:hypothetical protein